jgi:hypothetical protein
MQVRYQAAPRSDGGMIADPAATGLSGAGS